MGDVITKIDDTVLEGLVFEDKTTLLKGELNEESSISYPF